MFLKSKSIKSRSLPMVAVICFLLSACSQVISEPRPQALAEANLEPLYQFALMGNKMEIGVKSNGCTKAEDFTATLSSQEAGDHLAVKRDKIDRCRRMPMMKKILLNIESLGIKKGQPIILDNPVMVSPYPLERSK